MLSPRASVVLTTISQLATKPIGYIRVILTAYLFGASAGMDSFYIAQGAINLIMGLSLSIVQTAVMPNLMRLSATDDEAAKSFLAWVARFVFAWGTTAMILLILFPSDCIWLFASNLDDTRISMAAKMLLIMLPMGYLQLLGALATIWANYKKQYAVSSIVGLPGTFLLLLLLISLAPVIGVYAVAASVTISSVVFTGIFIYLFRDFPIRPKVKVPIDVIKKTGSDALMCIGMLGAGIMYGVTDRWFAAGLDAGNVTAISYAAQTVAYVMAFTGIASQMHLTHSSRVSLDAQAINETLNKSLAIGWAYMLPVAFSVAALAFPIIKILFGYGAFDAKAIEITAPCLAIEAIVMPLSIWGGLMGNYGLATSRLKLILSVSYISVCLNIFLDWLFAPIWGAAGICAATSLNQGTLGLYYMYRMAPKGTFAIQIPPILPQIALAASWSSVLFYISDNTFISLFLGGVFVITHLLLCEYFGWLTAVPQNWRPRALFSMVLDRIKGSILKMKS